VRFFLGKNAFEKRVKALDGGKKKKREQNGVKERTDGGKKSADGRRDDRKVDAEGQKQKGEGAYAKGVYGSGKIRFVEFFHTFASLIAFGMVIAVIAVTDREKMRQATLTRVCGRCKKIGIMLRVRRLPLFGETVVGGILDQHVNDAEERGGEKHTESAVEAAEERYGYHDPYSAKLNDRADDLGENDVTVDLLNGKDDDGKPKRQNRVFARQDQNAARDTAKKGTNDRNEISDGHDDGDEEGVGNAQDWENDQINESHDRAFHDLADQIFSENAVGVEGDPFEITEHAQG
jgi:hypothetical protein